MKRGKLTAIFALLMVAVLNLAVLNLAVPWALAETQAKPEEKTESSKTDLTPRLQEIYDLRAQWLVTGANPPSFEKDYLPGSKTAQWALHHEKGKFRYMREWTKNRGVQFVEAKPKITVTQLSSGKDRARFYVAQSLLLGYKYPEEENINRFGVGTRHIVELRRKDDKWLISLEWYTDPLGDDTEVPDVMPALVPQPLPLRPAASVAMQLVQGQGYDRAGAVEYANKYCGLAWGCGNDHKYNPRYRDYNGVGGDCSNFVSQAIRDGGKLKVPIMTRVDSLAGHLQHTGKARVVAKEPFGKLWQKASSQPQGFRSLLKEGDLIAYQEKGKLEHFGIVTGFDSRGYPLVNSHTADRYLVPFDLGWDRKTVYWLFQMRD